MKRIKPVWKAPKESFLPFKLDKYPMRNDYMPLYGLILGMGLVLIAILLLRLIV